MMTEEQRRTIRRIHHDNGVGICWADGGLWPCSAIMLLRDLEAVELELVWLREQLVRLSTLQGKVVELWA